MINNIVNTGLQPAVEVRNSKASSAPAPSVTTSASATPNPAVVPAKQNAADATKLKEAVTKLNDYVQNVQRNLSFSIDKDSGQTVVKVYDAQTNEVIRQIPSDETLKLAASIGEEVAHFFVKEKA